MNSYDPMKESEAEYLERTKPKNFQPQTITIDEFRRQQREKREALGIPQIDPNNYKLASDRPLTPDPPEKGTFDYYAIADEGLVGVGDEKPAIDYYTENSATTPPKPKPRGGYILNGVEYIIHEGEWRAKNPDGTIMTPGQMWNHTSIEFDSMRKKPGNVTGKPVTLR